MSDPTNPDHYKQPGKRECIEIIEELGWCRNFYLANAFKYMYRAGHKSAEWRSDIAKAEWYLSRFRTHTAGPQVDGDVEHLAPPGPTNEDVPLWTLCGCGVEWVSDQAAPWAQRCPKCNAVRSVPPGLTSEMSAPWLCGCGHTGIVRDGSAPWAVRCTKCNAVRMFPPPG